MPADAELTQVVSDAIRAGGVDVFALTMTMLEKYDTVVHWHVVVTLPTAQVGALLLRHSSSSFVASIISNANILGGTHLNSLYSTSGTVDTSAGSVLAIAPPPPPPPVS